MKFQFRMAGLFGLTTALIWPALWNHGPFYYPDTRTYMRSADAIAHKLTNIKTAWTAQDHSAIATVSRSNESPDLPAHSSGVTRTRSLAEISKRGIVLGRSPFYGMLLYIGAIAGGFWLAILLQAGAIVFTLYLSLRALSHPLWPAVAYVAIGLSFVSDAPFFASYLMPDLFAGIAILACAVLISINRRLAAKDYALWYLVLSAAMLFHDSCALISVSLLGIAVVANLPRGSWINWRALCVIPLAAVTAYAGQSLVAYGVKRATGETPLRLPFLSARLIADGPGTEYLRVTCPESHFTLCQYVNLFPMPSEEFLYGPTPPLSVFELASYPQRRAISEEQFRFLLAVVRYDPVGVLKSALRNGAKQLIDFRLVEFNYSPDRKTLFDRTLPLQTLAQVRASAAYRGEMPVKTLTIILYIFVAGSLVYLSLALSGRLPGRRMSNSLRRVSRWVFAGILVNAILCGCISNQLPRYQARVVWLFPLLALVVESQAWVRLGDRSRAEAAEMMSLSRP